MVSWKTSLNDQQMRDVTAYVRSLVKKAAPPAKDAKGTTPPKKK
jgi:mono/diheme cytochrome c family protein